MLQGVQIGAEARPQLGVRRRRPVPFNERSGGL